MHVHAVSKFLNSHGGFLRSATSTPIAQPMMLTFFPMKGQCFQPKKPPQANKKNKKTNLEKSPLGH